MRDRRNEPVRAGMRLVACAGTRAWPRRCGSASGCRGTGVRRLGRLGQWRFLGQRGNGDGLQPRQVRRSIADQGFRVLSPLRRNGSVFVADVLDRRGRHERLIVAAADAQILQRFYLDDRAVPAQRRARPSNSPVLRPGCSVTRTRSDAARADPVTRSPPGVPNEDAVPARRYGDLDDGGETTVVPALPVRPQPPIKTVKPRPRLVDRTPDSSRTGPPAGCRRGFAPGPGAASSALRPQTRRTRAGSVRTFALSKGRESPGQSETVPAASPAAPTRRPARPSRHAERRRRLRLRSVRYRAGSRDARVAAPAPVPPRRRNS